MHCRCWSQVKHKYVNMWWSLIRVFVFYCSLIFADIIFILMGDTQLGVEIILTGF